MALFWFPVWFRSSRTTADLLTNVCDRIARPFNRSEATRPAALNISKAFNRVWHAGLLQKLRSYGISGQIFDLIFLVIGDFGWFWMGTLNKDIQLMLEFHKGAFLLLHFSYYTLMTFLMMLSVILLSMLIILQYYPLL